MNSNIIDPVNTSSSQYSLNITIKRPITPKFILPLQNLTSILSPKKLSKPELNSKSILNNNNLLINKFDKLR